MSGLPICLPGRSYSLGTDSEVGSAWTRAHSQMMSDGNQAQGYAPSEFVSLSRSFWPGSARLSVAMWSGDIEPTFESLAQQVCGGGWEGRGEGRRESAGVHPLTHYPLPIAHPLVLSAARASPQVRVAQSVSLSGVVLWTSDIGGYKGGNATDPVFQELIVRWFQFGAFCPVFRLHGKRVGGPPTDACGTTNGDNEAWSFGAPATAAISSVMALRESLRPYVANISTEAAASGLPMLRPLVLAFPRDPNAAQPWAEGTFMLGPDWLVAPVTAYGAASAVVYLPSLETPGDAWVYHFNASLRVPGGGVNVTVATPLAEFPLFVRVPAGVAGAGRTGSA